MKRSFRSLIWALVCLGASGSTARAQSARLIEAIIAVESNNNDSPPIGDCQLAAPAYGPLQIRQPVCDDVNRYCRTHYRAERMQGNRPLSVKVFRLYQGLYATRKRLGHEPTDEDWARIWNGGPNGWRRRCTKDYWRRVKSRLK